MKVPYVQLDISIENLRCNYRYFRKNLKNSTKTLILVKANSYGHGAIEFAKAVEEEGASYLGVATTIEGIELKKGGIKLPVLVLSPGVETYPDLIDNGIEIGVPNMEAALILKSVLRERGIISYPIHLKMDTGMHRLGFQPYELEALTTLIKESPEFKVTSIYSHLAASDEPQHDEFTLGQISLFEKMFDKVAAVLSERPLKHILNSAGIERFYQYQFDMVRLGIGIYGISAIGSDELKPAAYFRVPIIQINELTNEDGSTVGYGRHGKLGEGCRRIATISAGYADGVNRHLGRGAASFEVRGVLCPTIGNICMDMCMIDVTGTDAQIGDTVTIFGDRPHARELAAILGTIPYEVFTSVARRVRRNVSE